MTTVNMKDYVNGNVNENKAVQEVIGKISKAETKVSANVINTVVPILGNKERTLEQRAEDIGELKGILASSIASGLSKVILKIPVRLLAMDTAYQIPERTERSLGKLLKEWDYDSCELKVRTVEEDYFCGVDKKDRHVYLFGYNALGDYVFQTRKEALDTLHAAEKNKVEVSEETYYEEY